LQKYVSFTYAHETIVLNIIPAVVSTSSDNNDAYTALLTLFEASQKALTSALQDTRQGPVDGLLQIATWMMTIIGTIGAILTLINPDSDGLATLGMISLILGVSIGILTYVLDMFGSMLMSSSVKSDGLLEFQKTYSDVLCTANSLQCKVKKMTKQAS
jgi:hypothetical protein